MSCPSNPALLRPFIPIPCPGIRHARHSGGVGNGGGSGGGGGGGNDDCDGGVMTAKRNKSDQELRLAFIIVFLYIYYLLNAPPVEFITAY